MADYLSVLDEHLGVNVACMIGHNALRQCVMGEDAAEREATAEEIAAMRELMRQSMLDGAIGYSINRNPGHFREDGKPQTVEIFEYFGSPASLAAGEAPALAAGSPPRPGRLFILYLNRYFLTMEGARRSPEPLVSFLHEVIGP